MTFMRPSSIHLSPLPNLPSIHPLPLKSPSLHLLLYHPLQSNPIKILSKSMLTSPKHKRRYHHAMSSIHSAITISSISKTSSHTSSTGEYLFIPPAKSRSYPSISSTPCFPLTTIYNLLSWFTYIHSWWSPLSRRIKNSISSLQYT